MLNDFTTNRIFLNREEGTKGGLATVNRRKTEFAARLPDNTALTRYTRVVETETLKPLLEEEREAFIEAITRMDLMTFNLDRRRKKNAFKSLIKNHGNGCTVPDDERSLTKKCGRCGTIHLDGVGTLCRECRKSTSHDRVEVEIYHEYLWFLRDCLLNKEGVMRSKEKPFTLFLNRFINPEGVPLTGDTFDFIENGVIWLTPLR